MKLLTIMHNYIVIDLNYDIFYHNDIIKSKS